MKLSVVIPSSKPHKVIALLNSIQLLIRRSDSEVIVVMPNSCVGEFDNNNIRVVRVDCLYPPGKMRNIGAGVASGDVLVFLDDDCIASEQAVDGLVSVLLSNNQYGAVGCRIVSQHEGFWNKCADYCLFGPTQHFKPKLIELGAAGLAVRKVDYRKAGGFDDALMASEDWDICMKIKKNGLLCFFSPEFTVLHDHCRGSFSSIMRQSWRSGFLSGLIVQKRHYDELSWLARLSVRMGNKWLYWILIIPYSLAVSSFMALEFVRHDKRIIMYYPLMVLSRLMYHFGVYSRILTKHA